MPDFPTPFDGAAALYPVTQARRFPVAVLKFSDGSEQRYRQSAGVDRLVLELGEITKAEKDAIMDFAADCKGSFTTFDITLDGEVFPYMAFAEDDFRPVEKESGVWSMSIPLVQTRKG